MRFNLPQLELRIASGQAVSIAEGQGMVIRIRNGRVWLTEENHIQDVFLSSGEGHRLVGDGTAVLESDDGADVIIEAPVAISSPGLVALGFHVVAAALGRTWKSATQRSKPIPAVPA